MKTAYDLPDDDDRAFARDSDPDTSHEAAELMSREKICRLQFIIVKYLRQLGNMGTSEEVENLSGISLQSLTPRFRPMVKKNILIDSGKRKTGKSGRRRILWELVRYRK